MKTKPVQLLPIRHLRLGFGIMLVSLIVFVVAFSWRSWQSEKEDEQERLSLLAELGGKSIDANFSLIRNNMSIVIQQLLLSDGSLDVKHMRWLLQLISEKDSAFANLYITDLNGQILASAVENSGQGLLNIGKTETFILAKEAMLNGVDFQVSRPIFGRVVKKWVLPFRYAIRDQSGRLRDILIAPLVFPALHTFWQSLYLPQHARMGLLGDNRYLLSVYPPPPPEKANEVFGKARHDVLANLLAQKNSLSQGLAIGSSPIENAKFHFAFFRLPNHSVTFFVALPYAHFQQLWWRHNRSFYLLTLVFAISGWFIYIWTAKRNNRWQAQSKHQEEKFRSIYEGSNAAIILLMRQEIFDCNQRAVEKFGHVRKSEFTACSLSSLAPSVQENGENSSSAMESHITFALQQGAKRFEWQFRRKDGKPFPAEVLLSAFEFDGERILQATVHDITQRKNTEAVLYATLKNLQAANERLDAEKELNQKIIETSPMGIAIYGEQGECLVANPAIARHMGMEVSQAVAQNYHHLDSWENSGLYQLACQAVAHTAPLSAVISIPEKGGETVKLGVILSTLHQAERRNLMLLTTDLTESMQAQQALAESEERFRRVISEAPIPIMVHAEDGEVLELNNVWSETTGYGINDIPTTRSWTQKAYGDQAPQVMQRIEPLYVSPHRLDQGEHKVTCKDGSIRIWNITAAPVGKLPDGRRYAISTAQDVTERTAAQQQVEFLAYHDFLTGLPNRLLAKERFDLAVSFANREDTKVALLFLDLDKFKIINDSLGHLIGDALLKTVAARLKECLRETDTLCRQGGDEFLIVLSRMTDLDTIGSVAEKILLQLTDHFTIEGNELSTSLSIGIAVYPDDGKDYDTLLKKADTAMYQSKEAGRNTYRFYAEQMNADVGEHLQIRNNLRKGLAREEFVLHYQPQFDLRSNAVIGAEALIRWNHPEFGLIAPGRFIPLAEESGLIVEIGEWVLQEACRQTAAWHKEGLPELTIAVNLSAIQFQRGDMLKRIMQALARSGMPPPMLELELTASLLIQDTEKIMSMVKKLKSLGVMLSIDDFGTGYSSLSYLKRFAVDKLKIDRSFVRDMSSDPNNAVIVRTIVQMANNLNLKTLAEGVETEMQSALLRLYHCDEAQGFYFSQPLTAEEFSRRFVDDSKALI